MEKYTAFIIEPRIHQLFETVLNNFLSNLDERWDFIIFHGHKNKNFLNELINNNFQNHKNRITLILLNINNINLQQYSKILVNPKFYNYIPTEMFLIFQLDTLISDIYFNKIYDFLEYDYVGAPWFDTYNKIGDVGNGGLSLRRKSKMLEIINNTPYNDLYEDAFFSFYKGTINKPDFEKAKEFSVEAVYHDKSFGIHKAYCYMTPEQIAEIYKHIPKITELITHSYYNDVINYNKNIFDDFDIIHNIDDIFP
jgi:hypothetical protein